MKVKVLVRNPDDCLRETKRDIHKLPRNYDPKLHPFEVNREYQRALNATKLSRVFAKPFLGCLEGHKDGVQIIRKHPTSLSVALTGSYDGELKFWNLQTMTCLKSVQAHDGYVRGIAPHYTLPYLYTCSEDKTIKQWSTDVSDTPGSLEPLNTITSHHSFYGIDHQRSENKFATCGDSVHIWDEERSEPIRHFDWEVDSVTSLKFNAVDTHLLGAVCSNRTVILYDMRSTAPMTKVLLKLRSNAIVWNPMESMVFSVANEDYNIYTFDMRKLDVPANIHSDHVSAVMDIDYSPTGRELVSGSYDKTVRIFDVSKGHSRDVYHTKRMQKVMTVSWSLDDRYILSGSDEMNLRLWKARASEKMGLMSSREKRNLDYSEKLREKFVHHPEIKKIARRRHVPKAIHHASRELHTIRQSQRRKEVNRRLNSKLGTVPHVPERKKTVLETFE